MKCKTFNKWDQSGYWIKRGSKARFGTKQIFCQDQVKVVSDAQKQAWLNYLKRRKLMGLW